MCDVVWKLSDVDHARCRRNTGEDIGADTQRCQTPIQSQSPTVPRTVVES
jgi:hypothetical protein